MGSTAWRTSSSGFLKYGEAQSAHLSADLLCPYLAIEGACRLLRAASRPSRVPNDAQPQDLLTARGAHWQLSVSESPGGLLRASGRLEETSPLRTLAGSSVQGSTELSMRLPSTDRDRPPDRAWSGSASPGSARPGSARPGSAGAWHRRVRPYSGGALAGTPDAPAGACPWVLTLVARNEPSLRAPSTRTLSPTWMSARVMGSRRLRKVVFSSATKV